MTTKKKLLTALSMFALVAVVAAVSVGITFAALSGNVKSTFNITYTASNVEATVTAQYSLDGKRPNYLGSSGDASVGTLNDMQAGESKEIKFELATTNADAQTKTFDAITNKTFADQDSSIYIKFTFQNDSADYALKVTPTFTPKQENKNVTLNYYWDETGAAALPSSTTTFVSGNIGDAEHVIAAKTSAAVKHVLWIRVDITDNIKEATFSGDFGFTLVNGDHVEP